jgi:peptidoglycan/xylan/chitin deacetylase (PgdA/CDA1 family)
MDSTGKKFFSKIDPFIPSLLILGLAVPAMLYVTIMVTLGWSTPVLGSKSSFSLFNSSSASVYLYESPETAGHFAKIGGNYETLLKPWREYFSERKRDLKLVKDTKGLTKMKSGVLILPSALALSAADRSAIAVFREKGGAVLATWATGTRGANGDWAGWKFLEELGVSYAGDIPNDADTRHLVLSGESVLSHSHPAGQRLLMAKTPEMLLRLKGEAAAGRFMNLARISDESRKQEGAVMYSELKDTGARSAVFAFSENAWESRPIAMYSVIDDTLRWLAHEVVATRGAWPMGKRAAQVVEMDVEDGFSNALNFTSQMRSNAYPATCYVLTSIAKTQPEATSSLAKECEIAFHGDVHESFKGVAAAQQRERIVAMKKDMATLLPNSSKFTGFRAPMEGYDFNTETILLNQGFKHHAVDPQRSEARMPFFAKPQERDPDADLVVLPRTQRDDINLASQNLSVDQTAKALKDDLEETLSTGALGWLSLHSQNFQSEGVLAGAFPEYLSHLKTKRSMLWVATANQVTHWWHQRDRFKLESSYNGKRFDMNITVKGERSVDGATVILMLPRKGFFPHVSGTKVGMDLPKIETIDAYRAALVFDSLAPGNHGYQVTFDSR